MFGVESKISKTDEFVKAGILPKTIRLKKNGVPKESMSFPTFKFNNLVKEEWKTSILKTMFDETKFMFVIFQFNNDNELIFKKVMFWNIPIEDLAEVRKVWQNTVEIINQGVKLISTARGISSNLPKQSENRVAHVRPHGKNANDKLPLPDGKMMTKQCFWLNSGYLKRQITD